MADDENVVLDALNLRYRLAQTNHRVSRSVTKNEEVLMAKMYF
jgi:hypothetical protein